METETLTNISRKMHRGYTLIDKCTKRKETNALGDNSFVIQNIYSMYREKLNFKEQPEFQKTINYPV